MIYDIMGALATYSSRTGGGLSPFLQSLGRSFPSGMIFFVERHPTVDMFIYRYDSRFPSTRVYERAGSEIHAALSSEITEDVSRFRGAPDTYSLHTVPLYKGESLKGFILLASEQPIPAYKVRILRNLSGNIADFVDTFQSGGQ